MATNKPQGEFHKQGIRIPKELHARLHAAAAASERSYNSELIYRLDRGLSDVSGPDFAMLLAKLESNIASLEVLVDDWKYRAGVLGNELSRRLREIPAKDPDWNRRLELYMEEALEAYRQVIKSGRRYKPLIEDVAAYRVEVLSNRLLALERGEQFDDKGLALIAIKTARARAETGRSPLEDLLERGEIEAPPRDGVVAYRHHDGAIAVSGDDLKDVEARLKQAGITQYEFHGRWIHVDPSHAQQVIELFPLTMEQMPVPLRAGERPYDESYRLRANAEMARRRDAADSKSAADRSTEKVGSELLTEPTNEQAAPPTKSSRSQGRTAKAARKATAGSTHTPIQVPNKDRKKKSK